VLVFRKEIHIHEKMDLVFWKQFRLLRHVTLARSVGLYIVCHTRALKPLEGVRYHLLGSLVCFRVMLYSESRIPTGREDFGGRNPQFAAMLPIAKLLWLLSGHYCLGRIHWTSHNAAVVITDTRAVCWQSCDVHETTKARLNGSATDEDSGTGRENTQTGVF